MMVSLAVVALALGTARIWNLRSSYLQKTAEYALEEQDELKILRTLESNISRLGEPAGVKIDRGKMISIPTPDAFKGEFTERAILVLPLVDDHSRRWRPGWCTHARDFEVYPDVEFLSGGVNHQTPTSAGLWRQGNLLHFGFEQSPAEMSDSGKLLLLNAIAYISHFTEDRPIAITPSPFAGPVARGRSTLARWLRNPEYSMNLCKSIVAPETWMRTVNAS
jgi:hypothetical protein